MSLLLIEWKKPRLHCPGFFYKRSMSRVTSRLRFIEPQLALKSLQRGSTGFMKSNTMAIAPKCCLSKDSGGLSYAGAAFIAFAGEERTRFSLSLSVWQHHGLHLSHHG
jgi:hypothetical protein